MIDGQYAAINGWMSGRMAELREVADARGYGFRALPLFQSMDMASAHNKWMPQSLQKQGFFLTTAIRREDLADVMKWCDFFFTEQSDELAYWGSPDWYTGKGAERRYTPAFRDLQDSLLYGTAGGRDGAYYGIGGGAFAAPEIETPRSRLEVKPLSLFPARFGYPLAPYWVYPKDALQSMKGTDLLTCGRKKLCFLLTASSPMDKYFQLWKDAGIDALEAAARAYMTKTYPRIAANAIKD